jgi:ABC-type bacteriocin/lantibiotic exporter with double-glycine peptidase domain
VLDGFKLIGRPLGWKRVFCFFGAGLMLLSSLATADNDNPSERNRIIPNVPFFPQEMYQCGPASLAEVFHFWGKKVSPEDIAKKIYSKSARGTLNLDMVLFPERNGFAAKQFKGDIEVIRKNIDAGYPLVVMVDLGFSFYEKNHFLVIFGYNEEGLWVHSGKEKSTFLPIKSFMKTWEKTNFWTLLITPKEHEK